VVKLSCLGCSETIPQGAAPVAGILYFAHIHPPVDSFRTTLSPGWNISSPGYFLVDTIFRDTGSRQLRRQSVTCRATKNDRDLRSSVQTAPHDISVRVIIP